MNVPDDWNSWYSNCLRCGTRFHASEGGCGCTEDLIECQEPRCSNYCDEETNTVLGGRNLCPDPARCVCCHRHHDDAPLTMNGEWVCKVCDPEEHDCSEVEVRDEPAYREPTYQDDAPEYEPDDAYDHYHDEVPY